ASRDYWHTHPVKNHPAVKASGSAAARNCVTGPALRFGGVPCAISTHGEIHFRTIFRAIGHALQRTGHALQRTGNWVNAHRGEIATVGATLVCVAPGVDLVGCGLAQATAWLVRGSQREATESYGTAFKYNMLDLLITGGAFAVTTPAELAWNKLSDRDL